MSESREPAETTGTDRWTKASPEAADDPRAIEEEAHDTEGMQSLTDERHLTHAEQSDAPDAVMGTSSDTGQAEPPFSDD